jgi:ABC-type glycerol-3-phosphate transport system substrate-binding protein
MTRKTRLVTAVGAVAAVAAMAGAALSPAANADVLGKVVVQVAYADESITWEQAEGLTSGRAQSECASRYPDTKSVSLETFTLAASSEGQQLQTLWNCQT